MGVRKCPKCGSVWYTALVKCAFCGVDGEEVKGPISPAKLNLSHGGVSAGPAPAAPPEPKPVDPPTPPPAEVKDPPAPPMEEKPDEAPPTPESAPVTAEPPPPPPPEPKPVPQQEPPARRPPPRLVPEVEPSTPAPLIPSATVPLVFGILGLAACLVLPLVGVFRNDRVLVILVLLGWAILAPFAPSAWFAGQRYLDRCRALGFSPAPAARTGKVLGTLASFVLVFEFSALSVFVAVQALSGKIVCPLWK